MTTRRRFLQATAGTAAAAMAGVTADTARATSQREQGIADYSTTPDPTSNWGTWEGWGTSLCWWANVFGTRNDLADIMFTRNTVTLNNQSLPGLGLNIIRYNVGACSDVPVDGQSMVASPNIKSWKQIEGYWLDWYSSDPASSSWNWWVDSNQRNMMWKARDRGVNLIEFFSDSPMWWMCKNHNPSGADDGGDNLQSWNYQQHAVYLATVAKYATDNWGINVDSVDAFNEPSATWWTSTGTQEGCHVSPSIQQQVIQYLRAELNTRGLTQTLVAASDETSYDAARSTWNSFSSTTKAAVGRVNVHGYQYEGGRRDLLYNDVHAAGKPLWQSEYGEDTASGMRLATNLCLDMKWLHPTAWCYWQVYDGLTWGLIYVDEDNGTVGQVNPKYWVMAQYTRHIRPGMRIISGGADVNTVAAYDTSAHRLVLVTANYGTAQWVTYDLSKFSSVPGAGTFIRRWITQTGTGGERYAAHHADTQLQDGKKFWGWFPANTIQTFEVDNVWI
jgi:galactan endo-1,6-beta-galactosidase